MALCVRDFEGISFLQYAMKIDIFMTRFKKILNWINNNDSNKYLWKII